MARLLLSCGVVHSHIGHRLHCTVLSQHYCWHLHPLNRVPYCGLCEHLLGYSVIASRKQQSKESYSCFGAYLWHYARDSHVYKVEWPRVLYIDLLLGAYCTSSTDIYIAAHGGYHLLRHDC